jgi:hypothetical protein
MSFKVYVTCPRCFKTVETKLSAFFGEGKTEVEGFCTSCCKPFIFSASFSTALVDQVKIHKADDLQVSAAFKNFDKAQPRREQNKRIRMWRTIASACKRMKRVVDLIAGEVPACAQQMELLHNHVKYTRARLKAEGVISDGKG